MWIENIALKLICTPGRAKEKMYNRPHIWVVQHAVKRVILRLIGIALPAARLATIAKNLAIGPLFAVLRREIKVAAPQSDLSF